MLMMFSLFSPSGDSDPSGKMESPKLKVGSQVVVLGKNIEGTVAFIGVTQFSPGT